MIYPFKTNSSVTTTYERQRRSTKRHRRDSRKERLRLTSWNESLTLAAWFAGMLLPRVLVWPGYQVSWTAPSMVLCSTVSRTQPVLLRQRHEQWRLVPVQKCTSEIKSVWMNLHLVIHPKRWWPKHPVLTYVMAAPSTFRLQYWKTMCSHQESMYGTRHASRRSEQIWPHVNTKR